MEKLNEAKEILRLIGMPAAQQSEICAYSLLALCNIVTNDDWSKATNTWIRIHDIIEFVAVKYKKVYAENSRETIRKSCLHQFREAALVEDNGKSTNSPNYRYRITNEALLLLQNIHSPNFKKILNVYLSNHESLISMYDSKKKMAMMPVQINAKNYKFSPGKHNELQKKILEEFAPRFASNSECLYVGDTTDKELLKKLKALKKLGFEITAHDKMPDVVLYKEDKQWIYFIEAVTSVGPMSPQRVRELNEMTRDVNAGIVFVTAFLDFDTYRKFSSELAWETEVWIAEAPDHMIHLNGDKFLGPHKNL